MITLDGPIFNKESLTRTLSKRIRREGVRRRPIETLTVHPMIWRPFRRVHWHCSMIRGQEKREFSSLLDEQCAPLSKEPDERLLLWRPRYVAFPTTMIAEDDSVPLIDDVESSLVVILEGITSRRNSAQEREKEMEKKVRRMQSDMRAAVSFLIPRTPAALRREDQTVAERKGVQAVIISSSIVTNCPRTAVIDDAVLGDRVYVGTITAEYRSIEGKSSRWVFLETPGASSMKQATRSGSALTRLCRLNDSCLDRVRGSVNSGPS